MGKVLIVNDNMNIGGIQKSLINLLKNIPPTDKVSLLLFSKSGALLNDVPSTVEIITPNRIYAMLGLNKKELKKHPVLFILKFILKCFAKITNRRNAMRIIGIFQKKIENFDTVISYSHLTSDKDFSNGCGDFVLDKTISSNKVCMIHCDYEKAGYFSTANNNEYKEFDKIVCCSESVKKIFERISKIDSNKLYVLRNFFDLDILEQSEIDPYIYDKNYINLITVARLSSEKGIDRFIKDLIKSKRKDIRYYIVGNGPMYNTIYEMIKNNDMKNNIFLLGESQNPYKYMKNADYFVLPSYHEAAPIVFDEANILGLPIISSNTTSAKEMIYNGIICDNFYKELLKLKKNNNLKKINSANHNKECICQFYKIIKE